MMVAIFSLTVASIVAMAGETAREMRGPGYGTSRIKIVIGFVALFIVPRYLKMRLPFFAM